MRFELANLNPQQREAVVHRDGPLLLLAGAGSGKTRVITTRIAYLIDQGVNPENILAVSFTNKAANEMRERVAATVGKETAGLVNLSTFHSLGANILRAHIGKLGYRKPFSILDAGDQLGVVKSIMKEKNIDADQIDPKVILQMVSRAKMAFKQPVAMTQFKFNPAMPFAQRVFVDYQQTLKSLNATDFDDLICLPIQLFEKHEDVRKIFGDAFQYVMVDEYQDTNETQLRFVRLIVADHHNVCVVGDDDQSIYAFRGAVSGNILTFEEEFPGTKTIKLEQNYRSTNVILNAANALIAHNPVRKEKSLWSSHEDGELVRVVECSDEHEEAEFVIAECERLHADNETPYEDMAILYRVNPQSRLFEDACIRFNVPYTIIGAKEFYDRKEVKDAISFLQVCVNPRDEVALRRIVNVPPRGIGPTTLAKISNFAEQSGMDFFATVRAFADGDAGNLGFAAKEKIKKFLAVIDAFKGRFADRDADVYETAKSLLEELNFLEYLRSADNSEHASNKRLQNVEEFLNAIARNPGDLETILTRIALDRSNENEDEKSYGVRMMTVHASKGLEFDTVFVVGCEEGYLPHQRSIQEVGDDGVEEERRLMYVAITRAKETLTLTRAAERTRFGEPMSREPSRFLDELPEETCQVFQASEADVIAKKKKERNQRFLSELRSAIFD